MTKTLAIILLLMTINLNASETGDCIEGKVRMFKSTSEQIAKYCFDDVTKKLLSFSSLKNNIDQLARSEFKIIIKQTKLNNEIGQRGSIVCREANGTFQDIEYWNKKSWIKNQRCLFNDGSFIDISSLLLQVKYE